MLIAGEATGCEFTLRHPATAALSNADSLPAATLVKNGVDLADTVTVTNKATGIYKATWTTPEDAAAGDEFQVRVAATVAGVSDADDVFSDTVSYTPAELSAAITADLANVSISVPGSISPAGVLSITQGDSYASDDGRALTWTISSTQPEYTSAAVVLHLASSGELKSIAGSVTTATGATRVVTFELTADDTNLPDGVGQYEIQVTLASGNELTPVYGTLQIRRQIA